MSTDFTPSTLTASTDLDAHTGCPLRTPADFILGNVTAILPDRQLNDARIVVRNGLIEAVEPDTGHADIDGGGALCLPGLVDTHADGLERERMPRPGADFGWMFGLASFEGRLRAAGVTTVFHGASYSDRQGATTGRSVGAADEMCTAIGSFAADLRRPVDHRVLYRLDVRSAAGLSALQAKVAATASTSDPVVISHEDHTPGIGQYADRDFYERYIASARGVSLAQAREQVAEEIRVRDANLGVREESSAWLAGLAEQGLARVFGHDPASAVEVADLARRGGSVAEFPTTVEAATEARRRHMPVVMGGPNALRGRSHTGNASATELARLGLLTALASDYLPSALLGAVFALVDADVADLPTAVSWVSAGPAAAVGLTDRGSLTPGLRADLALVSLDHGYPLVHTTFRAPTNVSSRTS